MISGPLLVLSAAIALQTPEAGLSSLERRKAALIEEIEGAAVAEPPVFGIDTQIRAAGILAGNDDAHAIRFLLDAGQRSLLLSDPATRSHFLKRIVEALMPLDARQAESYCAAQVRAEPAANADPLAVCYNQVVSSQKDWPARKDAFGRALTAGAYDLPGVEDLLLDARAHHSADFAPLLAGFIAAFPANPRLSEITRLEAIDRKFAAANRALSRQARQTISAARREYAATHPESPGSSPESQEARKSDLAQTIPAEGAPRESDADAPAFIKGFFRSLAPTSLLAEEDEGLKNLPDISKLGAEDAIRLARQQEYAGARAAILSDVLEEKAAQLEPRHKVSLAEEILRNSEKMRLSSTRLVVQAQLVRWFHQQGEKPKAGEAARALEISFDSFVLCKDQLCAVFQADANNSPGELVMEFAEYLWKYEIEPAELGLRHNGLRARWLLIKLQALLEDKKA